MGAIVRDVMTTSVVTVRGDTPFKELAAVLASSRVSGFPVIDQAGKVIGVVSETDMLIKEADQAGHPASFAGLRRSRDREKAAGVTAAELMTSPPVTIGPDEPVQHAAFLMYDRAVCRLPVVDQAGHLVGIISQADVLSIFSRPDEEIRREVTDRVIPQGLLIDPGPPFRSPSKTASRRCPAWPGTARPDRDIIEAVRRIEGVAAVRDQRSPADDRLHTATS